MEKALRLGRTDEGVFLTDAEKRAFLALYHHPGGFSADELRFRDDSRNVWWDWEPLPGHRVETLTRALQRAGFMPNAAHDGIFGYVTQAAVRLFQEYVHSIELPGQPDNGQPPCWPDGIVGNDTAFYLREWEAAGETCRWASGFPTEDYLRWMQWLQSAADAYRAAPNDLMQALMETEVRGDTLVPADWRFSSDEPHLIGLRRHATHAPLPKGKREPDDLFILLIRGMTFYFWGSTDANPAAGAEAYLVEGQHRYRFNWHNVAAARRPRIYKAARPAGAGVLVVRDVHGHNALTPENRRDGRDPLPNPTINIHWSGLGISNWSAGCQVISGRNYLNDVGALVRCNEYAARNDGERGSRRVEGGPRLTMGAYTLLSDLLLCYTPPPGGEEKPVFRYTLFPEDALDRVPGMDQAALVERLNRMRADPV